MSDLFEKNYDTMFIIQKLKEALSAYNFINNEICDTIYDISNKNGKGEDIVGNWIQENLKKAFVANHECNEEPNFGWTYQCFSDDAKSLLYYLFVQTEDLNPDYLQEKRKEFGLEKCYFLFGFDECSYFCRVVNKTCCRLVKVPLDIFDEEGRAKLLYHMPFEKYIINKMKKYAKYLRDNTEHDPHTILETIYTTAL